MTSTRLHGDGVEGCDGVEGGDGVDGGDGVEGGNGVEGDDVSNQTECIRVTIEQTMDGQYPSNKTTLKPLLA